MNKHLSKVATLILGVMVVAVVAVSLPAPQVDPAPRTVAVPTVPQGNKPVAPGSYTSIPEATPRAETPRGPLMPVASAGYRPVAPGAYTSIPVNSVSQAPAGPQPAPTAPDGYRPVAPGSYTSIPASD
jgi:hypothetical protein